MEVALFATCLSDALFPRVPEAVVRLLHREGVKVTFPRGQTCCGQPAFNSGFHDEARQMARNFIKVYTDSPYIITPSGSCASMVRVYYPELFAEGSQEHRAALAVADRTYEFSEFMVRVLGKSDLGATFPGRVTYHRSCHMARELGVVEPPITLLMHVSGLTYVEMPRADLCCGFGGTFSVRMADISIAMADEKIRQMDPPGFDMLVGSDAGCIMQLAGRLSFLGQAVRSTHLAEFLAVGAGLMQPAWGGGGTP